jgi:hypothetical protein
VFELNTRRANELKVSDRFPSKYQIELIVVSKQVEVFLSGFVQFILIDCVVILKHVDLVRQSSLPAKRTVIFREIGSFFEIGNEPIEIAIAHRKIANYVVFYADNFPFMIVTCRVRAAASRRPVHGQVDGVVVPSLVSSSHSADVNSQFPQRIVASRKLPRIL